MLDEAISEVKAFARGDQFEKLGKVLGHILEEFGDRKSTRLNSSH